MRIYFLLLTMIVSFVLSLGSFWFVYGLWPRSWWLFFLFAGMQIINTMMMREGLEVKRP